MLSDNRMMYARSTIETCNILLPAVHAENTMYMFIYSHTTQYVFTVVDSAQHDSYVCPPGPPHRTFGLFQQWIVYYKRMFNGRD